MYSADTPLPACSTFCLIKGQAATTTIFNHQPSSVSTFAIDAIPRRHVNPGTVIDTESSTSTHSILSSSLLTPLPLSLVLACCSISSSPSSSSSSSSSSSYTESLNADAR